MLCVFAQNAALRLKELRKRVGGNLTLMQLRMFLSRLWMVTALRHFQPPVLTVHNARMELPFGGCFRLDLLMKRPHNFIDAQNAITLGATTPSPNTFLKIGCTNGVLVIILCKTIT